MKSRRTSWAVAGVIVSITAGYSIVRADSPYPKGKMAPVIFSGSLSSNGTPMTGQHQIAINLWQANDTSSSANRVCQGTAQTIDVVAGNFQLTVDDTCVEAFAQYTQLFHELVVDGTPFPLQQIGSMPFAVRSARDYTSGTRLTQPRSVRLYGDDGLRGDPALPLTDTKRGEACSGALTSEGFQRCMPAWEPNTVALDAYGTFLDNSCTEPAPLTGMKYYVHGSVFPPPPDFHYLVDLDSSSAVTAIYPATPKGISLYVHGAGSTCQAFTPPPYGPLIQYTVGAAIPLTEFVRVETVTEY